MAANSVETWIRPRVERTSHTVTVQIHRQHAKLGLCQQGPPQFSCLASPSEVVECSNGCFCTLVFDIKSCRVLTPPQEDQCLENMQGSVEEEALWSFLQSAVGLLYDTYNRLSNMLLQLLEQKQPLRCSKLGYLRIINDSLAYINASQELKIIAPLFYLEDRQCLDLELQVLNDTDTDSTLTSNIRPIETELCALGRIMYNCALQAPPCESPVSPVSSISCCDPVITEIKHRGYSQELGEMISSLLAMSISMQQSWSELLASPHVDCESLSKLSYSIESSESKVLTSQRRDRHDETWGKALLESLDGELRDFLQCAKQFCNNTFRSVDTPKDVLLSFLKSHDNITKLIDYFLELFSAESAIGGVLGLLSNTPADLLNQEAHDLIDVFDFLFRYSFDEFALHEFLFSDAGLSRKLLLLPNKFSRVYAYAFRQLIGNLLKSQAASRSLLSAFIAQPDILMQIVSNIHWDDIFIMLFNIVDIASNQSNPELHPLLINCVNGVNLCEKLLELVGTGNCITTLSAAMRVYDQLLNSQIQELFIPAINGLPMLLKIVNLGAAEIMQDASVSEDKNLFMITCLRECGRVFSVGLALVLKTAYQLFNEATQTGEDRLRQTIERIYPEITSMLQESAKEFSRFLIRTVQPFPDDATQCRSPHIINHLHSYLMFYARILSTTADLKHYLYSKQNSIRMFDEFNGQSRTRLFPQKIAEPIIEASVSYSARAGAGGPSQVEVSDTYSQSGHVLPISLHHLIGDLINCGTWNDICKLFCVFPEATMLHFAISRIFIPCVELFISDQATLETILTKTAFLMVGQHFAKDCSQYSKKGYRYTSGLTHYINLFKSLIRISARVSDRSIFALKWRSLPHEQVERGMRDVIPTKVPLKISELSVTSSVNSAAVEYLMSKEEIVYLSACLLDADREMLLLYGPAERVAGTSSDCTDSSDLTDATTQNVDYMLSERPSDDEVEGAVGFRGSCFSMTNYSGFISELVPLE